MSIFFLNLDFHNCWMFLVTMGNWPIQEKKNQSKNKTNSETASKNHGKT